jgi:hypothetical protein
MLTTIYIGLTWADEAMRVTAGSFNLRIQDPRVLLAAHRVLLDQPGVQAADLVESEPRPYFVTAMELPRLMNTVDYLALHLNGEYVAQTVLSGGQDRPLQTLELRMRLEVLG